MDFLLDYKAKELEEIVAALKDIIAGNRSSGRFGLCTTVGNKVSEGAYITWEEVRTPLMMDWEFSSGEECHPVPVPDSLTGKYSSPSEIYNRTINPYEGEYGELRLNLASYIIDRLNKTIKEREKLV